MTGANDAGPDPARISDGTELAAALRAVKGRSGLSFRKIEELAPPGSAEALPVSTVEGWFARRNLPSLTKLHAFLRVCGIPEGELQDWTAALHRATKSDGLPSIASMDPIRELGVHQAAHLGGSSSHLPELTPYVVRDHDRELRELLQVDQSIFVMLVGGSSVGKTRAAVEAVRDVVPGWSIHRPLTAPALLAVLDGGGGTSGSIVWLDEAQRFLQPPHGENVAVALKRLLVQTPRNTRSRIIVLGTMWLSPYWRELTQPRQQEREEQPHVHDLLTDFCLRLNVAENFRNISDDQRAELERVQKTDPRFDAAIKAGGSDANITQVLAGGPLLLQMYQDLEQADPVAHAVLSVAMDVRSFDYQAPIPAELLEAAAPEYLNSSQKTGSAGWLKRAIVEATQEVHGIRWLTPVRTDPGIGDPNGYVLHDYLAQYAVGAEPNQSFPRGTFDSTVNAIVACDNGEDARRLLRFAANRTRLGSSCIPLLRVWERAEGSLGFILHIRPDDNSIVLDMTVGGYYRFLFDDEPERNRAIPLMATDHFVWLTSADGNDMQMNPLARFYGRRLDEIRSLREAGKGFTFERFTHSARRAIALADQEAKALTHNYIGTEHILLGLLHEPSGSASILRSCGFELENARQQVSGLSEPREPVPGDRLAFTSRAKRILRQAFHEADQLGVDVATEHMLLAIIVEGEGAAVDVLIRGGSSLAELHRETLDFVAKSPQQVGNPEKVQHRSNVFAKWKRNLIRER